jgi:hypothetical protein
MDTSTEDVKILMNSPHPYPPAPLPIISYGQVFWAQSSVHPGTHTTVQYPHHPAGGKGAHPRTGGPEM